MSSDSTGHLSIATLHRKYAQASLTVEQVVNQALHHCETVQNHCNAFTELYNEDALKQAKHADALPVSNAELPLLHGVPMVVKDFTPIAGKLTSRGSHLHKNWLPDDDPVIIQRLKKAGAIIVGRSTTPEYAFSSFTESPRWGITRNPWNKSKTPGGSSGGSAVAVATGCVPVAEGTDMGGSIRIPAALCGVVGLKPSLGRIPMDILPTCFDSIAHFGPISRTVADAARFLQATAGPSRQDIQSIEQVQNFLDLGDTVKDLRIAVSIDLGFYAVHPDVVANTRRVADLLTTAGAQVESVRLPWTREIVDAWFSYWAVFQAAALDGQLTAYRDQMDPDLVRLIEIGQKMSAVAYRKLEFIRTRQWLSLGELFRRYDILLCPTVARPAPDVGLDDSDFDDNDANGCYAGLDMTCVFNNVGQCPVISVPSGFTQDALPTGVQLVADRFCDPLVLRVASALEQMIGWPQWRTPN